jgi:uncharacterized protein (DUF1810 family)
MARMMAPNLDRFLAAQASIYPVALAELRAGEKRSHWMWFIFPQIAGLGSSDMARRYGIRDSAEAQAYLAHPLLGERLTVCTAAVMAHAGAFSAEQMLGGIDAMKLRSSMTLFECAARGAADARPFARCLEMLFGGRRDERTLALLE